MGLFDVCEVYNDFKFSHGMWHLKDNVSIDWATERVKSEQRENSLYTLYSTRVIRHRGDTLNSATVTNEITSPAPGVIALEAYHHSGTVDNESRFELNLPKSNPDAKIDATNNTFKSGSVSASLDSDPKNFGINFTDDQGNLLTKLGFRSLGYVRDRRENPTGAHRPFMTAQLHLSVQEKVYGFGERFGPFAKNGQSVEIWNRDGGTSSEQGYKSVPFYLTSRGYGIFVDHTSIVNFEVQSERTTRVNISVPGEKIRFYVIHGPSPKDIIHKYNQLVGAPALPPPQTFGLWLSTSFTTNYDYDTVYSFLDGMRKRNIPLDTFHFDCFWMKGYQWTDFEFDHDNFKGDPKKFLKSLKDEFGIKICVWINSYIAQESRAFKVAHENGYLIKNTDGSTFQTDLWQAGMGIVDFTNPDAWNWYQKELKGLLDKGVDYFKTDFGERIPVRNVKYFDGSDPETTHNYYTHLYNKCVFELLEKERGKHQACLFARSATAGGQQFPVHWGGDCEPTYEAMAETVRGGLSLSLSGFGFWSHDIGGFEGTPSPDVYKRWVAFGLLSSHSRLHGSGSYRVPWNFDDEASEVLKKFVNLKLSLMPYIYEAAVNAHKNSVPVLRSLLMEFPEEVSAWNADTQFLLGPSLLVAPVFDGEAGKVTYYVPEGNWYGLLDGKIREGGKWHSETHDFKSIPLLVRPNSIVVSGNRDDTPEYAFNDGFTVNLFDIKTETTVSIPDHKKLGEFAATVTATPQDDGSNKVAVSGDAGNWKIKTLGRKIASGDKIETVEQDYLGNSVASVKSKGSGSVIVKLA